MTQIHIHQAATADARIGAFTSVWYDSNVESGAVLGENCNLGRNVYVCDSAVVVRSRVTYCIARRARSWSA